VALGIIEAVTGRHQEISLDFDLSGFSYTYTCMLVFIGLFLISLKKDLKIFIKINTFGALFIILIVLFIIVVGVYGLATTKYEIFLTKAPNSTEIISAINGVEQASPIALFNLNFAPLMGIFGCGYYLHNLSLPIVKHARNPENSARDVTIGFFLVYLSNSLCGALGYIGFVGSLFKGMSL
jgi:hypothetical protein